MASAWLCGPMPFAHPASRVLMILKAGSFASHPATGASADVYTENIT